MARMHLGNKNVGSSKDLTRDLSELVELLLLLLYKKILLPSHSSRHIVEVGIGEEFIYGLRDALAELQTVVSWTQIEL